MLAAIDGKKGLDIDVVGWAWPAGDAVNLDADICRRLERLAKDPARPPALADADAVRVLTHEVVHATGVADEAVTECDAIQRMAGTARRLGVSGTAARADAALVWRDYRYEAPGYSTPLCHDGGPLDLRLLDPRWP